VGEPAHVTEIRNQPRKKSRKWPLIVTNMSDVKFVAICNHFRVFMHRPKLKKIPRNTGT